MPGCFIDAGLELARLGSERILGRISIRAGRKLIRIDLRICDNYVFFSFKIGIWNSLGLVRFSLGCESLPIEVLIFWRSVFYKRYWFLITTGFFFDSSLIHF